MNLMKILFKISSLIFLLIFIISCKKSINVIPSADVEKWTYFTTDNGLPSNKINCLAEDGYNNIWIGTDKGLVKYDGNNFTYYSTKNGLPSDSIYSIFWDGNAELLVGTQNGFGLINFIGNYSSILKLTNLPCGRFSEDRQQECVYCATNIGIIAYYYKLKDFDFYKIDSTLKNGYYISDPIYDITSDKKNNLWVTAKKGVYVYTNTDKIFYSITDLGFLEYYKDEDKGPLLMNVLRLFTDKTGNLWITPACGENLKYFTGSRFVNDSIFFGLNNYKSIVQDQYNNYWISIANKGVLNHGGGMTKVYNTTNSKIISNDVNALLYDSKNGLWLGSNDKGLMHYENIRPLQLEFGKDCNSTLSVHTIY